MKFLSNKNIIQKIIISIVIIIVCNFSIPMSVQADVGGILMSPLVSVVTVIFDGIYNLMEWAMLGETNLFIKESTGDVQLEGEVATSIDIETDIGSRFKI